MATLFLTLAFVLLGVLLLSLNLKSAWRWPVKAAAILVTGGFAIGFFMGVEALRGWPIDRSLPESFTLHASLVQEPSKISGESGAIYLWLSAADEGGEAVTPRAHRLPYSRELHERLARAEAGRSAGRDIRGRRSASGPPGLIENVQIELFEAPPAALPDKTVG